MSQDRSLRSRFQQLKASRRLRDKRRSPDGRKLQVEQLEHRALMAGLVGGGEALAADPLWGAEGEVAGQTPRVNVTSPDYRYVPTKHYAASQTGYLTGPASGSPLEIAVGYLKANATKFGLKPADLDHVVVKSQLNNPQTGATHIYLKQTFNGLEIANADLSIHIARHGEVINVASSFVGNLNHPTQPQPVTPGVSPIGALTEFGKDFGYAFSLAPRQLSAPQGPSQRTVLSGAGVASDNIVAELQYVATPSGLELAWRVNVPTADRQHWWDAFQAADDGNLLLANDWVANARYNVFPIPVSDPTDGVRAGVVDPHDVIASPFGWHDANGQPGAEFFDTRGNNVFAQADRDGIGAGANAPVPVLRPTGGPNLDFDYPLNLGATTTDVYTNAAVTNLFYLVNMAHDITYRYGFDEASGNFQSMNYSGLGRGGDPVLAFAQVGGNLPLPLNNASMSFPPDGVSPVMTMGEFNIDFTSPLGAFYAPRRDTSLVAEVVLHEYFHGVTNRLTGGPLNSSGLQSIQSRAMGEGWSDFFALWSLQRPTDQPNDPVEIGSYLAGPSPIVADKGLRRFPYSHDLTVNPLTFSDFNIAGGTATCATPTSNCAPHNAGEIWASALWDMNWMLIDKYGYNPDVFAGTGGNNLAMRLVTEGLKLQPVNPTFLQARDAILQADIIMNRGVNHKEIWSAFARRGMGFTADSDILDLGSQPAINPPIVFVDSSNSVNVRQAFDMPNNTGSIQGRVFLDANGNGVLDNNEAGIGGVTIFLDTDNDGVFEPLEPTTTTAADGSYEFEIFVRGEFRVGQVVPAGFQQTTPAGIGGQVVTVVDGQTVTGVNFGNRNGNPLTTGMVFHDFDLDGRRDEDEPGIGGVYIYADYDGDKRLDLGEPQTVTAADGTYNLRLDRPGTYFVREVIPAGYVQTFPQDNGGFMVNITNGALNANFEFGIVAAEDWGDAPDSYRTLATSNGAVHGFLPGFYLGTSVDLEADGNPSAGADGDDLTPAGANDENGVQFTSTMFPGSTTTVAVTVNLKDRLVETVNGKQKTTILQDNSAGRLHAWVDFNRDGDFDDAGEKIISNQLLLEGTHNLSFNVPRSAVTGVTYARFRYGYEHSIGPNGRAQAGEVEDYQVRILTDTPDAQDDVFTVDQNSLANQLNVLLNDIPSANGPLTILSVSPSARGATIVIAADGRSLRYTPQPGSIGNDSFTYTVRDPAGVTDTAQVSVTILPAFAQAIAVDDSFTVNEGSANNELNILANDLAGRNPPISIVFPGSPANGTVEIDNRGTLTPTDDVLRYTPNTGFFGTDQFQYTIEDANLQQSTATVTVHVQPGDRLDDVVQYRLEVTDINNRPIQAIGVGETFKLRAYVQDLRPDDTIDDGVDRRGVGAAYFDALYPYSLVSLVGNVQFSGEYTNATSGRLTTPGIIDEVGALQGGAVPLGSDEELLFEIMATATGVGTANFIGDPADQTSENPGSPDHDTVFFEPPSEAVLARQIRFVDTSLEIVGSGGRPVATDNTFTIPANSAAFPLNVLANDVEQNNPPLRISAVGSATSTSFTTPNGSQVTISPDGSLLLYTPRAGFNGTEQFSYTVRNAVGLTSTAVVTAQVGTPTKDVLIRLEATTLTGQPLTGPVLVGDDFLVRVLVQDTRAVPPDPTRMGVFAAYLDLLYDGGLVSTIGDLTSPFGFRMSFGPEYDDNGLSASNALPNVINELGAFQSSFGPLGPNEYVLAQVTFNADRAGTATFVSDPADLSPLHDVLLFEPDETAVPLNRINFRTTSVTIVGAGEGEQNPFHNQVQGTDVNRNGLTTPQDALIVINTLNASGSRALMSAAQGEAGATLYAYDVNNDGFVTPIDALQVINRCAGALGAAEGEGTEGFAAEIPTDALLLPAQNAYSSLAQFHERVKSGVSQTQLVWTPQTDHETTQSANQLSESEAFANSDGSDDEIIDDILAGDVATVWSQL